MLEQCDFMELTEEVLQQCNGFTCKDADITEFFTHDYADATHHNPDHYRFDSYLRRSMDHERSDSLAKSKRQRTGRCRLFGSPVYRIEICRGAWVSRALRQPRSHPSPGWRS